MNINDFYEYYKYVISYIDSFQNNCTVEILYFKMSACIRLEWSLF